MTSPIRFLYRLATAELPLRPRQGQERRYAIRMSGSAAIRAALMPAQDAAVRIIEQTRSLLRSERFLVISTTPLNSDRVEALLTRFPQVGIIVTSDGATSSVQDHSRLGRRLEPGKAHWQMPTGTFQDAVI